MNLGGLGKVAGGALGGSLGGPVGAAIGTSLGGMLDGPGKVAGVATNNKYLKQVMEEVENLEIPDIEKQKILLETLGEEDFLKAQEIKQQEVGAIQEDPRYRSMMLQSLGGMQEIVDQGLNASDRQVRQEMIDQEGARSQQQNADITRQMAERGALDSGNQLAMQLASQQQSAQRRQQQALQMTSQAQNARMAALQQQASMAGQISDRDFNMQKTNLDSRQALAQLNQMARMGADRDNLGIKQSNLALKNQQEIHNKGLLDKDFQNRKDKIEMFKGAAGGMQSAANDSSAASALAKATQAAARDKETSDLIGAVSDAFKPKDNTDFEE